MSFRQSRFSPFGGGGIQFGPGLPLGSAVKALLIANSVLFFVPGLIGLGGMEFTYLFGLVPDDVFAGGRIWQLGSYMFLHGSFMHLFMNMLMLWMFGTAIEHAWGSRDFWTYYLVCGVGAGLTQFMAALVTGGGGTAIIGASGAVYGVLLAYGLSYPNRVILLNFFIPIKVKYLIWLVIAFSLIAGLADRRGDNVAHFAHLGGMLFGYVFLKQDWRIGGFTKKIRRQRAQAQMKQNAARVEQQRQEKTAEQRSVDEILDKISEHGIDSLTEQERRILRNASRH